MLNESNFLQYNLPLNLSPSLFISVISLHIHYVAKISDQISVNNNTHLSAYKVESK